jgi:membrane protein required for beta-lactamase induction
MTVPSIVFFLAIATLSIGAALATVELRNVRKSQRRETHSAFDHRH